MSNYVSAFKDSREFMRGFRKYFPESTVERMLEIGERLKIRVPTLYASVIFCDVLTMDFGKADDYVVGDIYDLLEEISNSGSFGNFCWERALEDLGYTEADANSDEDIAQEVEDAEELNRTLYEEEWIGEHYFGVTLPRDLHFDEGAEGSLYFRRGESNSPVYR